MEQFYLNYHKNIPLNTTVSPSLGRQVALVCVGWTGMLEPGHAGVLILLRYFVPTVPRVLVKYQ